MKANRNRPLFFLVPLVDDTELVEVNAQGVGVLLELLEDGKTPGRWTNPDEPGAGYQFVTREQARLLMGATDRIVNEIRATRNGVNTPLASQDALLNPYTLPLASLSEIAGNLSTNGESAAAILAAIRLLQQQANAGDAASQEELLRIGAIIAGAI